jgi:antitoxin (DNA-binding transcriptional repressor) of toxin-antitoxin stability system
MRQSWKETPMAIVAIEDAQAHLPQVLAGLKPGEQLVITQGGQPLAVVTRVPRTSWPCKAGSAKDTTHWMAPDFDAPLEDFREYME